MPQRISGIKDDPFDKSEQSPFRKAASQEEFPIQEVGEVLIVKPYEERCPAESCITLEGIVPRVKSITPSWELKNGQRPEAYAGHLAGMWQRGEEFINLEHDVAPWPGALAQLHDCPEPYCHYYYPYWPPGYLTLGIGCMKFGQAIIDAIPDAWEDWGMIEWWNLDGVILTQLKRAGFTRHEHTPPVAHVRRGMGVIIS